MDPTRKLTVESNGLNFGTKSSLTVEPSSQKLLARLNGLISAFLSRCQPIPVVNSEKMETGGFCDKALNYGGLLQFSLSLLKVIDG